jgi:hypothetical protein
LFWKTNVLHLYFFSFELNNSSRIPKGKIEQHYISPFLCIYLSLLATNYFAFMHHFIFFKVKLYKKKFTTEKISIYWTRPNFTDCIKKGLGSMIFTVVTGSVMYYTALYVSNLFHFNQRLFFNFLWFAENWEWFQIIVAHVFQ